MWADKTLEYEGHADAIFAAYPSARMVHVIRDPRDRFASQSVHRRAARGGVGSGIALWLWSADLAERNQQRFGDRYLVVRLEDLLTDSERTLRSVCAFIREPYAPTMLETVAGGASLRRAGIGRYVDELDARQVAFIERRAADSMARLGYHSTAGPLQGWSRARFGLFDSPRWSIGAALWQVQRRRHRAPSARRTLPDAAPSRS
jgi:hypothetical protein